MYKVVDLFAGAGGLSLGFIQTGEYDIKVAFENNPNMQETYKKNHPDVDVRGDVCSADYKEIQEKYGPIDVVIGGPPCQGFSNANRQKNHAISKNNMLVKQYIGAILELQPKAFVMENVSMLRSEVHRFYLDKKDEKLLERYNIPVKETTLILLDKEYIYDGINELLQNPKQIQMYLWPEEHYSKLNIIYKVTKNPKKLLVALEKHRKILSGYAKEYINLTSDHTISIQSKKAFTAIMDYYSGVLDIEKIQKVIEPAIMYQRMLSKLQEIVDNELVVDKYEYTEGLSVTIRSYAVFDYLQAILQSEPNNYQISADVLCAADYGAPQKRMRFVVMGIKKELCSEVKLPEIEFTSDQYRTVREAIEDLEDVIPVTSLAEDKGVRVEVKTKISDLGKQLRNAGTLKNHIITKTTDIAMERFKALKQGQNFHSLDDSLKTNTFTDVSRTQNTVYLRLNYDEPSGTVVNVRKSMWVHPTLDRAVSIREAARLQTFPDSFVFCGSKDKQYQQVGNAVPPIMAKAIAEKLASQLSK